MPYEITFTKKLDFGSESKYFNECCFGGDIVANELLPLVQESYHDIQSEQEDWGWFIWFKNKNTFYAIDIFTDDPLTGEYRIHLTSRHKKKSLLWSSDVIEDTPELENLREKRKVQLSKFSASNIFIVKVDSEYNPKDENV